MSHLLGLEITDQSAMNRLNMFVMNNCISTVHHEVLREVRDIAKALEKWFTLNAENVVLASSPSSYLNSSLLADLEIPLRDRNVTDAELVQSQADRLNSVEIEQTVGEIKTKTTYYFSHSESPKIEVTVDANNDPERITAEAVKRSFERFHRDINTAPDLHPKPTPMTFTMAMEICEKPEQFAREALNEALKTLHAHILRQPYVSDNSR